MSIESTYTPDMSKIPQNIDTFAIHVDSIDLNWRHVDKLGKYRHILRTCRWNRRVAKICRYSYILSTHC